MAPSGSGEEVQPGAPLPPISDCVATVEKLGLDRLPKETKAREKARCRGREIIGAIAPS